MKKERVIRRKNAAAAAGSGDVELMLDESQDDEILESVIKSVTSPSSRQQTPRDRRRARTGARTSRMHALSLAANFSSWMAQLCCWSVLVLMSLL